MKKQHIPVAVFALALLVTGCYSEEEHDRNVYVPPSQPVPVTQYPAQYPDVISAPPTPTGVPEGAVVVNQQPPPVQPEVIPPAPGAGYVWSPGHWEWQGQWLWVGGYWVAPPAVGMVYVAPGWEHHPHGGWAYHGGHWRR
jgi:hypothetical protein